MRIAVLSGKGGTGKTLVSVNLAAVAENASYYDCDVEEPNGHLFFKPQDVTEEIITVRSPEVDADLCDGCRKCSDFCKFNAIASIHDKAVVFPDVCHPCGGCLLVCPKKAISEIQRPVGKIMRGVSGDVKVTSGMLNMGEESGVPIIRAMLQDMKASPDDMTLIDCPPGSACVVMESILDADYCVLVAEPTVFGVHNLAMVHELVQIFDKPYGVVLNKCFDGENPAEQYCTEHQVPVLGRIPFDQELGHLNSNSEIVSRFSDKYKTVFAEILQQVKEAVSHANEAASDSER
ncbi:MAG: ATP-binding protein [Peptococcaceae bacterium]|nr:ATP-binding protein [Peptococcaceae bacterium]